MDRSCIELFNGAGYHGEARIEIGRWPRGGPAPSGLDYEVGLPSLKAVNGEHISRRRGISLLPGRTAPLASHYS